MNFTDHLNRTVEINGVPQRVVSLVPSITETLADLGLAKHLVAVTRFCKYPLELTKLLPKAGGPKNIDIDKIVDLQPHLVIAVKEENDKEQVLKLAEQVPVIVFDINSVEDAFNMLDGLGAVFDRADVTAGVINSIKQKLEKYSPAGSYKKTMYLIWKNPWMAAGRSAFIGAMMKVAGFDNFISGRYPQVSRQEFEKANTLLLATEPYHFTESDRQQLLEEYPDKNVIIVDGEMFTWYGTHMLKAIDYFERLTLMQ